jgi:hypothetical protein
MKNGANITVDNGTLSKDEHKPMQNRKQLKCHKLWPGRTTKKKLQPSGQVKVNWKTKGHRHQINN